MSYTMWVLWAVLLIVQNFAFTYVSRARNSGSIWKHAKASVFSNGVWFIGQLMAVSAFMNILTGRFGWGQAVFAAGFYTTFTMSGSLIAHYFALKTEKGKGAVGANKKFHQVTVEEWDQLQSIIGRLP